MDHHDVSHKGRLAFVSHFEPPLEAGRYTLEVTQELAAFDNGQDDGSDAEEEIIGEQIEFLVSAPRFMLAETDIFSHYPPAGGDAAYDGMVASISFSRRALPWERSPGVDDRRDGAAWLALILVDEDELASGAAREVVDEDHTRPTLGETEAWLGIDALTSWERYDASMPLRVLELDDALYDAVLPAYGDLVLLSHARQNLTESGEVASELGTVLCNRLPTPGKSNTVYLVSIEHRYPTGASAKTRARHVGPEPGKQRLAYLHKWRFLCRDAELYGYTITSTILREARRVDERVPRLDGATIPSWVDHEFDGEQGREALHDQIVEWLGGHGWADEVADELVKQGKHAEGTFPEILREVDVGLLRDVPTDGASMPASAQSLVETGHTVLKHQLRGGGSTYSWLKGALAAHAVEDMGFSFPSASADDLLVFHESTRMLDATYAAAWALGRLKGMERKSLSVEMFRWRHEQLHLQAGHGHGHLPVPALPDSQLPADVVEQVEAWKLLRDIPFDYLVPHPRMLPLESLRFFHVDQNWMRCFIDGFFSVAKVHGLVDFGKEHALFPRVDRQMTGVLLRSNAVAGWPSMHVNAYAHHMAPNHVDPDAQHLRVLRKERLEHEVLLLLFDGVPKTLDLYLSPEGLHSGFERADTDKVSPRYTHRLRDPKTGEETTATEAMEPVVAVGDGNGSQQHRTFSAIDVNAQVENRLGVDALSAGDLGLQLIDKAPMVRYQLR